MSNKEQGYLRVVIVVQPSCLLIIKVDTDYSRRDASLTRYKASCPAFRPAFSLSLNAHSATVIL